MRPVRRIMAKVHASGTVGVQSSRPPVSSQDVEVRGACDVVRA
jgi:hypothetical protein